MDGWMDGRMDRSMDEWMDETDRQTDGQRYTKQTLKIIKKQQYFIVTIHVSKTCSSFKHVNVH